MDYDDLSAARGIKNALLFSVPFWLIVIVFAVWYGLEFTPKTERLHCVGYEYDAAGAKHECP